jgi:hypothetical protein
MSERINMGVQWCTYDTNREFVGREWVEGVEEVREREFSTYGILPT